MSLPPRSPAQKDLFDKVMREASYRDRAGERRKKFGVSKREVKGKLYMEELKRNRPQPAPAKPEQPDRFGIQQSNKGSQMLEKMGWKKGTGLGKEGQVCNTVTCEYCTRGCVGALVCVLRIGTHKENKISPRSLKNTHRSAKKRVLKDT